MKWDDTRILSIISRSEDEEIINYRTRQIMTCVYESQAHAKRTDAINMISKIINPEFNAENLLYDHVDKAAHKLTPSLIAHDDDSGKGIVIVDKATLLPQNIMDVSLILESIVTPINIKRIYAKKTIAEQVANRIKELQS